MEWTHTCGARCTDCGALFTGSAIKATFCSEKCYNGEDLPAVIMSSRKEKGDEVILANIRKLSMDQIMSCMDENPAFYEQDLAKLVLSYYIPKVDHGIQNRPFSLVVMGIVLGVPKRFIRVITKQVAERYVKWHETYETDAFDFEKFMAEVVAVVDDSWHDSVKSYVLSKYSMQQLITMKCPLVKKYEESYAMVSKLLELKMP